LQSLKKIAALPVDKIYPGHEEETTLEHELACNPHFGRIEN